MPVQGPLLSLGEAPITKMALSVVFHRLGGDEDGIQVPTDLSLLHPVPKSLSGHGNRSGRIGSWVDRGRVGRLQG